jgi:hypothetical protein
MKHICFDSARVQKKITSLIPFYGNKVERTFHRESFLTRVFFIVLLFFITVSNLYSQNSIILDSDSAKLFEGFGQYFVSPGQTEKLIGQNQIPDGDAVFKIVKVTNIQGNNPFNTVQPVYNFGGILLSNVDDLIECIRGGTCRGTGGGSLICSPNTGVSDVANLKDSVGCYIKANGTICRVEKLPSPADLKYESLFVMYDTLVAMSSVAGTDTTSDFKMTKPPSGNTIMWPGGNVVYKIAPGTYIAVVQNKNTGTKYEINFTVANLPGNNVRLTVNSLRRM